MIILVVLLASLALAIVRRGKISNLGLLNIRWSGLIFIGLLIQLFIFQPFWQDRDETRALTQIAYLVSLTLLSLALLANLRLPGLAIISLGFCLNFIAIVLNGGYMPASPAAIAVSGLSQIDPGQAANNSIGAGPDTRVAFLTDIFAIPSLFIFHNVFSIGDVLIAVGGFYLIQRVMVEPRPQSDA
jgi:hypothetical protein